jgi:DNA-binding NarL/FixJ family response regulator
MACSMAPARLAYVVCVDWHMPGTEGIEITRRLLATISDINSLQCRLLLTALVHTVLRCGTGTRPTSLFVPKVHLCNKTAVSI